MVSAGGVWRGRVVLVTGGSQGLGLALGEAFAAEGAKVALVARGRDALEAAVARVREAGRRAGGEGIGVAADIGEKHAVHAIVGEVAGRLGPIDVLINNASTLGPTPLPLLLDTECEDLERVLAVNLVGPFRLTKVVAGAMALRGEGQVVFISSDAAVAAYPRWGAYGASKAAADHLGRIFGAELGDHGVRVAVIDPGEMDTAMHRAALPDADPASLAAPRDVAARIFRIVGQLREGAS